MNTTVGIAEPETAVGRARVSVDIADPELDADVRAVLAALALSPSSPGDQAADLVVTDRPNRGPGPGPGDGATGVRAVRVAADRARVDDDEVVHLPSGAGDLVALLMAPSSRPVGRQITVVGAVGGCGASTVAAAVATRAAESVRTLLVETDPRGTGVDLLLGVEAESGLRIEDVRADLGGPDPEALWAAVPRPAVGLGILARSRTRDGDAVPVAAPDGGRGAARSHRTAGGLVVCDAGALGEGVAGETGDVVVVTRADLQGAVAARRAVRAIAGAALVVRTGRGDPLHAADVADSAGVGRWFVLPERRGVRRATGSGDLVGALSRGGLGGLRSLAALADALVEGVLDDEGR